MAKVGPDKNSSLVHQVVVQRSPSKVDSNMTEDRNRTLGLGTRLRSFSLHQSVSSLNQGKFDELMAADFASGFEESQACFSDVATKAAKILGSQFCNIFLIDEKEHRLYTFVRDRNGTEIRVTKPLDRGITGSIISNPVGFNVNDVSTSRRWSPELDELLDGVTKSYLAWPLWDAGGANCLGVVEFRNKSDRNGSFNAADSQLARIVAFQLGNAITHHRQQELLAGRNEAFNKAYETSFDGEEAIDMNENDLNYDWSSEERRKYWSLQQRPSGLQKRSAFALSPSSQLGSIVKSATPPLSERGWDFDVFLCSEEELRLYAVDVFDERGLFSRFSIPMSTFLSFIDDIKAGYNDAPYHNHFHGFDVMHVCYLLITRCKADEFLESFNIFSILVAALAHDLGHDGFNNAFHAAAESELAVTYNSVSILENYSAAYLFRILRREESNIFARLGREDMTKMRSRLIELILDTDAKNHFILMTRFKHGLEMKQLSRGLLSSMLLHVSDVSNPTRPGSIARKWAYAVQEEFFRQGDKEKELNIPRSPFMDRDFENLPRMQGAFIDALVTPVFKLLADFLPLVKIHCVKPLQINRAFWNQMQNQDIVTIDAIKNFMENRQKEDCITPVEIVNEQGKDFSEQDLSERPIPGIPSNAPLAIETSQIRKTSIIALHTSDLDAFDPELGEGSGPAHKPGIRLSSPRRSLRDTRIFCVIKTKSHLSRFLDSNIFQSTLLAATVYALFANDLNLALGTKEADDAVDMVTFFVLILFLIELVASLVCVPKYMQFFFWLDLAATVSLVLEVNFLLELGSTTGSPDQLSLAKAGRAAKAGARAGRLAKLLRLFRLVKIAKIFKWTMGFNKKKDEKKKEDNDVEHEVDFKMSVVGRKMTESITKKVIIAVMFMLLIFSLLEVNFTPDARQVQLDGIGRNPESALLKTNLFRAHDNIIELRGVGDDFVNQKRLDKLRDVERMVFFSAADANVNVTFDLSKEVVVTAWYSMTTTLLVTSLLAALSLLFSRDAYHIMIRPIEKMKYTVQQLSENPLLHLEKMKKRGSSDTSETDLLEQAINKMATLLQIGFGCAGAEIIAKILSEGGELDPMVPGVKVHAIFGFCDIRDFTFATEGLQQDVMLFVNKIAEITHKHVVFSGGAPNKNIGDAFLLVWKLSSSKNGGRSNLQKYLFDGALSSMQQIICDIRQMGTLAAFLQEETDTDAAWRSTLEDFKVEMGFGLHTGWAIEGSIGSKVKIDASYLSPHVNLASRLEAATKQYRVPLLMSEQFVSGLTGSVQSTCRRVDSVTFKGSNEPMKIFHQDVEPYGAEARKPHNYADLLAATSWQDEAELNRAQVDITSIIKSLRSKKTVDVREVYDQAFNAYLDGKWVRCKVLCHLWMERFPSDVVVQVLVEFLMKHNFQCPQSWQGFHALREK